MSIIRNTYSLKIILVGEAYVGKTAIIGRYTRNEFSETYANTVSLDFNTKTVVYNNDQFKLTIWDTAGEEKFKSLTNSYFKSSGCCILVYSITDKNSFKEVQNWLNDINYNSQENKVVVLIGNKIDLEDKREILYEEGEKFAKDNGILFFETSAKTGKNINEAFICAIENIQNRILNSEYNFEDEFSIVQKEGTGLKSSRTSLIPSIQSERKRKKGGCCKKKN